ncbi:MAG: hypothetical protein JST00_39845 [Deltaproteobacteria bacterium]|nr:hypothetical protein [Deltaproteobacteria bacterium]
MSVTVHCAGKRLRLADRDLLGVGGEGRVYRCGDRAIKIYFAVDDARRAKLAALVAGHRAMHPRVVGPLDLCTDPAGDIVGFAMKALDGAVDMHRAAQRRWREQHMTANGVVSVFRDLASTLSALHARGVVVGDLNDGNVVLVSEPAAPSPAWSPFFIDADSMQLPGFPCTVAHERFLDPRLYGASLAGGVLSRDSDWYALAVMLFGSLFFVHPYGGAHPSYPTMLRRAEARHSVLRGDVKLPVTAQRLDLLPDDALAWFDAVFEKGRREPMPACVLEARFVRCPCGIEHARRACPACAVAAGAPLHAAGAPAPPPVVMRGKLRATRLPSLPSAFVPGPDHADAIGIDGDWLVRRASGMRIGQILEGQTHVRWGDSMGFAFYRASLVTMYFVFDPRSGPLRQIALPPLDGRLVEWSVVFERGGGLALFTTATEKSGRVTHAAHLVAANGDVVASEAGPPGSTPLLGAVTGKCLAGGAVLTATDDGLVLVRADRATRSFLPVRAFPETRDLVPPDADLLLGSGGSVYVVGPGGVVHLAFEGGP